MWKYNAQRLTGSEQSIGGEVNKEADTDLGTVVSVFQICHVKSILHKGKDVAECVDNLGFCLIMDIDYNL